MADHEHGSMSTRAQEKTFQGFIKISKQVSIAFVVVMIFLAIVNV